MWQKVTNYSSIHHMQAVASGTGLLWSSGNWKRQHVLAPDKNVWTKKKWAKKRLDQCGEGGQYVCWLQWKSHLHQVVILTINLFLKYNRYWGRYKLTIFLHVVLQPVLWFSHQRERHSSCCWCLSHHMQVGKQQLPLSITICQCTEAIATFLWNIKNEVQVKRTLLWPKFYLV